MAHCGGCAACDAREMAGNGGNGASVGAVLDLRAAVWPAQGCSRRFGTATTDLPRGCWGREPGCRLLTGRDPAKPAGRVSLTLWCRCELPAMNVDETFVTGEIVGVEAGPAVKIRC